jgi:hypothetical protein
VGRPPPACASSSMERTSAASAAAYRRSWHDEHLEFQAQHSFASGVTHFAGTDGSAALADGCIPGAQSASEVRLGCGCRYPCHGGAGYPLDDAEECVRHDGYRRGTGSVTTGATLRIQFDGVGVAAVKHFSLTKGVTMAEINKLSVGKVLDKLRSNDAPKKSRTELLDEKLRATGEELQRLRTATRNVKGTSKKPPAA